MILRIAREKVGHRQGPIQNAPPEIPVGRLHLCGPHRRRAMQRGVLCAMNGARIPFDTPRASAPGTGFRESGKRSSTMRGAMLAVIAFVSSAAAQQTPDERFAPLREQASASMRNPGDLAAGRVVARILSEL